VTPSVISTSKGLIIQYPTNLVFVAGQSFKVPFTAKGNNGVLVWAFHGLPNGILGNANLGFIQGTILESGYYNVQVDCADNKGSYAQAYITINVQPKSSLTSNTLVEVSSIGLSTLFANEAESAQITADKTLFAALDKVNKKKALVNVSQAAVVAATYRVTSTQALYDAANVVYKQASNDLNTANILLSNAQNTLSAVQQNLALAQTENNQSISAVVNAKYVLGDAQTAFDSFQSKFNGATLVLNNARANLTAAQITVTSSTTAEAGA
jgi:hypothetical protein